MRFLSCTLLLLALAAPAQAEPFDVSGDEEWSSPRDRNRHRYYGRAERELEAALLDREAEQASFDREQVEFGRDRRQLVRTLRARKDALEAKQEEEARRTSLVSDGTTDAELKRLEGRVREALDATGAPEEEPQAKPPPPPSREDQRRAAEAAEARAREEAEERALEEAAEETLKAAESREQRARQEAARKLGGKLDPAGQFVDPDLAHP